MALLLSFLFKCLEQEILFTHQQSGENRIFWSDTGKSKSINTKAIQEGFNDAAAVNEQ